MSSTSDKFHFVSLYDEEFQKYFPFMLNFDVFCFHFLFYILYSKIPNEQPLYKLSKGTAVKVS